MYLGKHFKDIRENKTYSQKQLTKGCISQSTYSKFESGIRNIDARVYTELLQRLNVSAEEFDYIKNGYKYGEKEWIINKFFSLDYNHIEGLKKLKKHAVEFLEVKKDDIIYRVYLICEALIQLQATKNLEEAQLIVEPIWRDISKYEQWYLNDIRFINVILFLFPIDIALEFTQTVLTRLDKYKSFQDAAKLKQAFKINLSLLLIKNKNYTSAYEIIRDSLGSDQRKMKYPILALHFSREAICLANLQKAGWAENLEKARQLLVIYDDYSYWERIQEEFNYYTFNI